MYTITKKAKSPNTVWDSENGAVLCTFKNGVLQTNDKAVADRLKAMGHKVCGKADKKED